MQHLRSIVIATIVTIAILATLAFVALTPASAHAASPVAVKHIVPASRYHQCVPLLSTRGYK